MRLDLKKKYIAAVSGGPDSMAMLDKYRKYIIGVCHVNYHKRIDSDYDTSLVYEYCSKHNIKLLTLDVNKNIYKNSQQNNFQALARTIRYEFFVECAKKFNCNDLLIAHNLNDFLETATMQENRKSLNFFYGIKPINKYKTLTIYRPLLNIFKSDLEKYCKDKHIAYAIDSSNLQDVYERNRVRKQINSLSKQEQKKLLAKFNLRNKKYALIEKQVLKNLAKWELTKYSVNFIKHSRLNEQILNGVIYLYLKKYNILRVNHNKIKMIKSFIQADKSNQYLRLEDGIRLLKKDKKIKVVK